MVEYNTYSYETIPEVDMSTLKSLSFEKLMGMAMEEYAAYGTIFGVRAMYKAGRARLPIFGKRIENPIGPAASPVTQTAQGIIAAYLSGARFIELKTVYPESKAVKKPYASTETPSAVTEAPTELTIGEAFGEYVKAWYAIKLLSTHLELGVPEGFIFQMSVGGCLKDLKSDKMNSFIEGLKSAEYTEVWRECENWARAHVDEFSGVDNMYVSDVSPEVSDSVTFVPKEGLSAEETEACAAYLIEEKHLHTFVRLSPDLLGYYNIRGILDINGYTDLEIDEDRINSEAQYDDIKPALLRLQSKADALRLEFGVKISDGLRTGSGPKNGKAVCGRALFPIAFSLAEKVANDFGGGLRICYSGGADKFTAGKLFDCGIWPVIFASDIMMPGGLMRLYETANDLAKRDYQQFSGILTSDLPDAEKEIYESGRYRNAFMKKPVKAEGKAPVLACHKAGCRAACPLGMDIPFIERLVRGEKSLRALKVVFERDPIPFITTKLCPHPCTESCARRFYEGPVKIYEEISKVAENACFDLLDETEPADYTGEAVAVVGAGAAGLSAAAFAAKQGMRVTVFDRAERPGGAIVKYLPDFMIQEKDVEWDVTLIQAKGIDLELEHEVSSVGELYEMGFSKVILATGAEKERALKLSFGKPVSALDFLEKCKSDKENAEEAYQGAIVVYGTGITAVTAARVAKKLPGADRVTVLLSDSPKNETISKSDMALLQKEGIFVETMLIPVGMRGGELFCHRATETAKDKKTGLVNLEDSGEKEKIACDVIINAQGEEYSETMKDADTASAFAGASGLGHNSYIPYVVLDSQKTAAKLFHCHYDRFLPDNESEERDFLENRGKLSDDIKQCERCLECETACGFCSDVCPNRANMKIRLSDGSEQIIHIDEFCDECGACADACPYEEEPFRSKFTLFLKEEDFTSSENDGFYVTGEANNCRFRVDGKMFKYDPINGPDGIVQPEIKEMAGFVMKQYPRLFK